MKVLGISGRYRDAAAALAVDGRLIAAVSEECFTKVPGIGYLQTGGFPSQAVDACLHATGVEMGDVDQLTVVEHEGPSGHDPSSLRDEYKTLDVQRIDAVRADAVQAAASADGPRAVLVFSTQPAVMAAFVTDQNRVTSETVIPGGDHLVRAAQMLAGTLGVAGADPYGALDRLSIGAEPEFQSEIGASIAWREHEGVTRRCGWSQRASEHDCRRSHRIAGRCRLAERSAAAEAARPRRELHVSHRTSGP